MTESLTSSIPLDDLDGRLSRPGDPDWDEARRAWNLSIDQQPVAVVFAASARDVVVTVDAARVAGLQVAPQSTGHSAGSLGDLSGTVLLRTDALRGVEIDPVRRTARVEGGARWRDVTVPAGQHGLAAVAGSAPGVGVAGYTLGGGLSWLARSHGLAANSVISFEVVTADGRLRMANSDEDPDLFWALRGGGGDYGIVTALEFRLYPVEQIYAGSLLFGMDRAGEVLHAWRRWLPTVPDSVTSVGRVLRFPPVEELPEQLRGQNFVVVGAACQLEPEDAWRLLAPLRALGPLRDTFALIETAGLADVHMDPVDPAPCRVDGALLSTLPAEAVDAVVAAATSESAESLLSLELRHLGGLLEPGRMEGGAVSGFDAEFAAYAVGAAPTPESAEVADGVVGTVLGALRPWTHGAYLNFADRPTGGQSLFGPSWERLRAVKTAYDPTDVIRSNHPVDRIVPAR